MKLIIYVNLDLMVGLFLYAIIAIQINLAIVIWVFMMHMSCRKM